MMRTEHDLRRVVDVPADDDAVDRLTGFVHALGTPRRRWAVERALPLAAAALVAGLVLTLGLVFTGSDKDTLTGSGPSGAQRPTWAMRFAPVTGYEVRNVIAGSTGTLADVRATDAARPERGSITSTPCNGPDPCGKFPTTTPVAVTVNGRAGSFWPGGRVTAENLVPSVYRKPWQAAAESPDVQPQLVWQDAGTTVAVMGTFGFDPQTYDYDAAVSKATMLSLARAVETGRRDDIAMPLALTDVPVELAAESVQLHDGFACIGYGTGRASEVGEPALLACRATTGRNDAATARTARIEPAEQGPVIVRALPDGTSLVVAAGSQHVGELSRMQLERLADEADVSPTVADPKSWLVVN